MTGVNKLIPNTWILLESSSSISKISNIDLVRDVQYAKNPTSVWTNDGFMDYTLWYKLHILNGMNAYFNDKGIVKVVSLSEVSSVY